MLDKIKNNWSVHFLCQAFWRTRNHHGQGEGGAGVPETAAHTGISFIALKKYERKARKRIYNVSIIYSSCKLCGFRALINWGINLFFLSALNNNKNLPLNSFILRSGNSSTWSSCELRNSVPEQLPSSSWTGTSPPPLFPPRICGPGAPAIFFVSFNQCAVL